MTQKNATGYKLEIKIQNNYVNQVIFPATESI